MSDAPMVEPAAVPVVPTQPSAPESLVQALEHRDKAIEELPRGKSKDLWKLLKLSADFYKFTLDFEESQYDLREARTLASKDPTTRKWRKLAVKSCKNIENQWDELADSLAIELKYCRSGERFAARECMILLRNSALLRDQMRVLGSLCNEAAIAKKKTPLAKPIV